LLKMVSGIQKSPRVLQTTGNISRGTSRDTSSRISKSPMNHEHVIQIKDLI
jgi:hypothetical protein